MSVPEQAIDDESAAGPPAPKRRRARPFVLRLHFYAGVLVAPFVLIAAITGALYAVAPMIERVVYGDILFVEPGSSPLPLSEQAAAARNACPQLQMSGMRPAVTETDSTRVYFADPSLDEEMLRAVFVDPYSGRVLGDEPTWFGYLPLSTWLDGLHRHLNLGEPGRIYSELAASWLSVVALGGLYLWIVKVRSERHRGRAGRLLAVDRSVKGRSRTLNWHGATGNLHPSAALVIVLAAVAVGWFLPLLGISLVGFVVVDVLIAAVKARRSAKSS